jgi:hypothetical protein
MAPRTNLILTMVVIVGLSTKVASADGPPTTAKKPAAADAKQPVASRVLVTIAKETTVITKPLRKDGYPDYIAALNEMYSKGVTPETNAVVLFWQAVGPAPIEPKYRAKYFQLLGIPVPADKWDYFIDLDEFVRRQNPNKIPCDVSLLVESNKADGQLNLATTRPWSAKEFPILSAWLAANKRALDLAVEASHRPRSYDPLVGDRDALLIAVLLPCASIERKVAIALAVRATLLMDEGKTEAAWQELLAVHRLGRLFGQAPMLVQALVSISIDGMACHADQIFLQHMRLSAADALRMRAELGKLAPLPRMDDAIDRGERFMFLDCVTVGARDSQFSISKLTNLTGGGRTDNAVELISNSIAVQAIDWDLILRMGNSWYDRGIGDLRKPALADRNDALKSFEADLRLEQKRAKTWTLSALLDPRRELSERIGHIFVSLLLPAFTAVAKAEQSAQMQFDLTELAFSLAAYRADHGLYPTRLTDLVPKYATEIPKDVFSAKELHYKPNGDGYVLYSVGRNGEDDGGRDQNDDKTGVGWDDIVVRMGKAP